MTKHSARGVAWILIFAGVCLPVMGGCNRGVGTYEYIRRAQSFLDEGNYRSAIELFLKAYRELPDNKDIKDHLVYGYLHYADALAGQGKLDDAVDLLAGACRILPRNGHIIRYLAYLYAKKAITFLSVHNAGDAEAYLEKSINTAMGAATARKTIANYLLNEAIGAYGRNDRTAALLCTRASNLLWGRFETFDVLGQLYYKESNIDMAAFYWQKALDLDPGNSDVREKLGKVRRDIDARDSMARLTTEHFNVQLYKAYGFDARELEQYLNEIYRDVGKDLRYFPPNNTNVVFYSEPDFRAIFKQPGIVAGLYDGSIRIPLRSMSGVSMKGLLAHEYTHAVLSIITDNRCPVWLGEGLATLEQARTGPVPLEFVKRAVREKKMLSLDILEQGFGSFEDLEAAAFAYQAAYTAASFIIATWGWSGMRSLLGRIKEGRHYTNAIDEEFLITQSTFERMWNEYLASSL
ncbi:MAG: peptidase MA family metallohydrolase [Candidatus Omnitrophica bacterium]|nr:peptidase MA family metallohydrolase [Candidatus Omnitrophota bacterium]